MSARSVTDVQITRALRQHLPADAPAATRRALLDAVETTRQQRPLLPAFDWLMTSMTARAGLAALVLLAALLTALVAAGSFRTIEPRRIGNGWIAYSTDGPLPGSTDLTSGSDLYLVREGGAPMLIAGRRGGAARNACPSFSPDGTRLAFATSDGPAIVVRAVDESGPTGQPTRLTAAVPFWPMCVRWSTDGERLAFIEGGNEVVVALDGSTPAPTANDPRPADFANRPDQLADLPSPSGERTARVRIAGSTCELLITRADGTDLHVIALTFCPYALAGWSPDSAKVLLMEDVTGIDFTMHAIEVATGTQTEIVSTVRTNGARSWPAWGDVSWQPVLP